MRRRIKEYLLALIAIALLMWGMQRPIVVKAQENEQQTGTARASEKTGVTVTNNDEFMSALEQKKSPIIVDGAITIGKEAEESGRMRPVVIPENTVIQGTGQSEVCSRSPIQLEGDGVCFQNISLVFNSTDSLGSVPHREIFLAGYSLTLDNVNTYKEGGGGLPGSLLGSEKELLPTVYAGGYTNTAIGHNAALTVRNSNDETMFQAIYMGHDTGADNNVRYNESAVLNLDAKVIARKGIDTSYNSKAKINITGEKNQLARIKELYGNENTTLTVDAVFLEEAVVDNIGNVVLQNKACLSPKRQSIRNVTLQNGACLNLNNICNAVIAGDFIGETDATKEKGILVLNREGALTINGKVTGTTQFQTTDRLFPGILFKGRNYIYATAENTSEQNFVLAQTKIEEGYELSYNAGVWSIAGEPETMEEIGRIEVVWAPSKVDLRKIAQTEDESIPDENMYFEVQWYDTKGNIFSSSDVEYNGFYTMDYVIRIRTDYWQSEAEDILDKTDWYQFVDLVSSEDYPGRYYLEAYDSATPGDYTFLFCSVPYEGNLDTVADVKALKDTVMAEQRVVFYDQDTEEPEKPEHTHSYQSTVTKQATCTEKGIKTYTCSCGDTYTESLEALGHQEVIDPAVKPTETTAGKTEGSHCSVCGKIIKKQEVIAALGKPEHTHSYQSTVTKQATCTEKGIKTYTCSCGNKYTEEIVMLSHKYIEKVMPATVKGNGKVQQICQVCSAAKSTTVIYKPQKLTLSKKDFSYDGKAKMPSVTVKDSKGKNLKAGTDYQVKYPKGRKNPGVYTVAIELCGKYSGKMTESFTIRPKKTSLKKVTARSKGMEVTWKKQATQSDGYQIQYCTSSNFKGKTLKTVTVKKNNTVKKISKLKGKKKYYVRIRTYKTVKVNGKSKKMYSDWSGKKTVSTKK